MRAGGMSRVLIIMGSAFILAACAPRAQNPFASPRNGKEGDPAKRHRVQLEVLCSECAISWQAGIDQRSARGTTSWSHTVYVYADPGGTFVSLSAAPTPGSRPVSAVRIRVDGKTAAVTRNDDDPALAGGKTPRPISAHTTIRGD